MVEASRPDQRNGCLCFTLHSIFLNCSAQTLRGTLTYLNIKGSGDSRFDVLGKLSLEKEEPG